MPFNCAPSRQIREPMQHRRLVVRRHAIDRVRERVRDVRVAVAVDGHVVREIFAPARRSWRRDRPSRAARPSSGCRRRASRDPLAFWSPNTALLEFATSKRSRVLVGFDADRRHELRVANERHDAAVALDDEDRAFGERARQEPAVVLVVLDAFGDEAAALGRDDVARRHCCERGGGRRAAAAASRRRRFGLGRAAGGEDGAGRNERNRCDAWRHLRSANARIVAREPRRAPGAHFRRSRHAYASRARSSGAAHVVARVRHRCRGLAPPSHGSTHAAARRRARDGLPRGLHQYARRQRLVADAAAADPARPAGQRRERHESRRRAAAEHRRRGDVSPARRAAARRARGSSSCRPSSAASSAPSSPSISTRRCCGRRSAC